MVHEFERDRSGKIQILQTIPSDIAIPRTVKSISRGGEEVPQSATVPAK